MSKLSTNSSVSQSNQIHHKSMSQLTEIEQENILSQFRHPLSMRIIIYP